MKYSIILPSYDPELRHHDMFMALLDSIFKNSKNADYELIIRRNGMSYTESFNDAFLSARGDYIISLQDDMLIEDPKWLEKLTDDKCFVTTSMNRFHLDGSDCPNWALFGMPKWIREKVGILDERFKKGLCFEDNDYVFRMKEAKVEFKVISLNFKHYGGVVTGDYLKSTKSDKEFINHSVFCEKWREKLHL